MSDPTPLAGPTEASQAALPASPQEPTESHVLGERRAKLDGLRASGEAFPNDFRPTHAIAQLNRDFATVDRSSLETDPVHVVIAGRMILKRVQGKASFATLQDGSHALGDAAMPGDGRLQLWMNDEGIGATLHDAFKHWDLGDVIGAHGVLFRTLRGELSLRCSQVRLLTKSIRPLPDKFHGLSDTELRYRQRYVDLIVNETTRKTFVARSRILDAIRSYMKGHDFLEVETPMLHPIPGGATAKPFVTHHNALDQSMYLRIAPELYLKRLVVGGFERVFEINRNFRNEGVSVRHNPEFTMMEFYAAYTDYRWMMDFTEAVIRAAAEHACASTQLSYQGQALDLGKPFERLTIAEAIRRHEPLLELANLDDREQLVAELARRGVAVDRVPALRHAGIGALQLALFEETAEAKLWQPTFIVDYPVEVSPLARESSSEPGVTERFELFIAGREIANGFSELNDPEDQAARFLAQAKAKEAGDEEAMFYDADYIRALEYGMPPAGGCGIGIDRLVMLLTDAASIRDVILFPALRHEAH